MKRYDYLVIGSGIAGMSFALKVARTGASVAIICKTDLEEANTFYAQGGVAGVKILDDDDDVILISQEGILIRMHAADINVQSRYGSGVRVMRLAESDRVVTVARSERDEENAQAPLEQPDAAEPVTESDEE